MKTLDEAITHCVEKAAELRKEADDCKEIYKEQCEKPNYKSYISNCLECSREYEQLAEWLKELKALKDRPQGDLISRSAVRKKCIAAQDWGDTNTYINRGLAIAVDFIDNAPTVKPQKIVTIPHELIEKLVLCVVDTVENIDWDKAIEAYKERPQVTVFTETADEKAIEDMKAELENVIDTKTKGEWIKVVENLSWHYECNQCHNRPLMARLVDEDVLSDFCPYCGADMRGTTNEP